MSTLFWCSYGEEPISLAWPKSCIINLCIFMLLGPVPVDYRIGSNFWKFYLTRIGLTLRELVFLVKVFRLFRLEWIFLVFRVWTHLIDVQHLIYWQGQWVCDALFFIQLGVLFLEHILSLQSPWGKKRLLITSASWPRKSAWVKLGWRFFRLGLRSYI
jgi:hypothetical protein